MNVEDIRIDEETLSRVERALTEEKDKIFIRLWKDGYRLLKEEDKNDFNKSLTIHFDNGTSVGYTMKGFAKNFKCRRKWQNLFITYWNI